MKLSSSIWIALGATSAFFGVAMGAFAAHALSGRIDPALLHSFQTGAQYQFYHALALVLFGLWIHTYGASTRNSLAGQVTGWLFLAGTMLFSGSLYVLAVTGVRQLGMVTPFGGVAFLAGWLTWAFSALVKRA